MPEELLNLLQEHPAFKEYRCHRVSQEMRVDPLLNLCLRRCLLHNLLDTAGRVAKGVHGLKEVARLPVPDKVREALVMEILRQDQLSEAKAAALSKLDR